MKKSTKKAVRAAIPALLIAAVLAVAAAMAVLKKSPEQYKEVNAEQTLGNDSSESSAEETGEPQSSLSETDSGTGTASETTKPENSQPQSSVTQSTTPSSTAETSVPSNGESGRSESVILTGAKNIGNVPIIAQKPNFPTGCESVSAVMVLKYLGYDITVDSFVDDYLPKSNEFYNADGKRYGPSPYEYFIGNPRSSSSYGCMAPVIEKALSGYLGGSNKIKNTTGTSLAQLCRDYIDNDIPVMVWASIAMIEVVPTSSWYLSDGTLFTWPGNEHCLVLTGYDDSYYYFNDSYKGAALKYARARVEDRYAKLGKQSLVVMP